MGGRGRLPGELPRARAAPARAAASAAASWSSSRERAASASTSPGGTTRPASKRAHDLAEAADVVDDRGDAGAERLEQRARLVELGPVGEDADRRLARARARARRRRGIRGATRRGRLRLARSVVERDARVARHEEPRVRRRRARPRPRPARPLYGPDHARVRAPCGRRRARGGSLRNTGWGTTRSFSGDAEGRERVAAALASGRRCGRSARRAAARGPRGVRCVAAAGRAR